MRLRKDGKPDGRTGSAMVRKPKNTPWKKPFISDPSARKRAKDSGFITP